MVVFRVSKERKILKNVTERNFSSNEMCIAIPLFFFKILHGQLPILLAISYTLCFNRYEKKQNRFNLFVQICFAFCLHVQLKMTRLPSELMPINPSLCISKN